MITLIKSAQFFFKILCRFNYLGSRCYKTPRKKCGANRPLGERMIRHTSFGPPFPPSSPRFSFYYKIFQQLAPSPPLIRSFFTMVSHLQYETSLNIYLLSSKQIHSNKTFVFYLNCSLSSVQYSHYVVFKYFK